MTDDTSSVSPPSDSSAPSDASSNATSPEPAPPIDVPSPAETQPPTTSAPIIPEESQSAQESKVEPPAARVSRAEQHTDPATQTSALQPQTPAAQNLFQSHQWSAADRARATATHARKKQEHLDKIIAYARAKPRITNDEIEKLLRVSDATASRYTKILIARRVLQKEGKGRGVNYILIKTA